MIMASAKKKLDEYHLKVLRQLVTLPANKECFDCHQRGPTYVNVTIGSFVCTTCSGMLRGLTPPHRVKSISMATFTPEEIDYVKARGNEYCRRVWLGLLDTQQPPTKDEQQIKDFMVAKYERKRYYLDPAVASTLDKPVNGSARKPPTPSEPAKVTSSSVQPPPPASLAFKPPSSQTNNNVFTPEPFADFNNLSIPPPCDPFNSSQSAVAPASSQQSFANFDNNPIFSANSTGMPGAGVGETATVPAEDRYAALKDLDCLMKSQQQQQQQPQQQQQQAVEPAAEWTAGVTNGYGLTSGWSAPSVFPPTVNNTIDTNTIANPFKGEISWNNGFTGGANPFRNAKPFSSETVWPSVPNGQVTNGFSTSQSLNFPAAKVPWGSEGVSNPFVVGPTPQTNGLHSSNPFL